MAYQSAHTGQQINNGLVLSFEQENNINNIPNLITIANNNANLLTQLEISINALNNPLQVCNILYPVGAIYTAGNDSINPNEMFPGTTWSLINNIEDTNYVNSYFGTTNLQVITWSDGSKWVPLVLHNVTNGTTVYSSVAQALNCATTNKISNLYLFQQPHDIFKDKNGFYEFILEYPSLNNYNRWKQRSNPVLTYDCVANYIPIHIPWMDNYWGGISRNNFSLSSTTDTFLSGGQNTGNWWYAICSFQGYQGGIPGPNSTVITTWTKFYVRVPQLEEENFLTDDYNLLKYLGCKYWKRVN